MTSLRLPMFPIASAVTARLSLWFGANNVIPMPVLPRRRDEIGEPVEERKRRELHDASGPGRVDLRPRPGPTQLAALCPGSA